MEAVQKDHWYFVALVFLPFLKVSVQQKEVVTVRLEEGMVLDCLCPWDGNLSMVSWSKDLEKEPIALYHPEHGTIFSSRYSGRTEFLKTTPMDGSIAISNVTHQDIGTYHCSVQTFPQGPWIRTVEVEDLDEPPEEDQGTEPPTPEPVHADLTLVAEQNDNVTLSCHHQHSGTVYQVILERLPHGQRGTITGVCKHAEGNLVREDYSSRGTVNCASSLDLTLHLSNVTQEDGGFYRCRFSTDAGEQVTTVLLSVLTPDGISLSAFMMYIYIGVGTACIVLLIAIVILAVRHRKKKRRERYRAKLHPRQKQPNFYENIPLCPRITKKPRPIRNCPVYANVQTVRSQKTRRQPRDKFICTSCL
ncbi:CD226 antigen isoform X4 [Betta splendens]|uniref:CD226 antigen isoform X4 n=1 Tax=Betta splendens TaxID=158456 RepID=A0A6P7M9A2_BETSP|nr:CD226 antigen isoform X4 [Betta splendens]